ncbi:hypothetical protein HPP92_027744 [Vanilla planifolia]|uniref:Uncharacterized protein n=1 Tax=Vanilla planifolia TaxID=51239 RepID=A0A835P806_VANPL|nr:hypothetical protein HPP92_027744 [Vanilla planifolia]
MIKANEDDPNWVLVAHNMSPECMEEVSGIDSENYIIISEETVVEGIANFIARCVIENPKSKMTSPIVLQKAVNKALDEIGGWNKLKYVWEAGKVIYALSTWGIFLAGLYSHRAIVKAAAKGIHASSKFVLNSMFLNKGQRRGSKEEILPSKYPATA